MAEPKIHDKPVDNFNESLIKYIIESTFYPNEVTDGGGVDPDVYRDVIGDAKTYREARNRILQAVKNGGIDVLEPAIRSYSFNHGSDKVNYSTSSFDPKSSKMEPIKVKQMELGDVQEMVDTLATALDFNDNGKEHGARNAFLDNYYGGDGFLKGMADAHSFDGSFYKEGELLARALRDKYNTIALQDELRRKLGYTPNASMDEILNLTYGLPAFAERAYRAYARDKDFPTKAVSAIEGVISPQVAKSMNEGRNPSFTDIGTDVAEGLLLGSGKLGKKVAESVLKTAGVETGLDFVHDGIEDALNEIIYSEGDVPISSRDYSDLADPSRLANGAQAILTGGAIKGGRALNKLVKNSGKTAEQLAAETEDAVLGSIARKVQTQGDLRNIDSYLKEINALRKKNNLPLETKEELKKELEKRVKEAEKDVLAEKRRRTASQLFGSLGRVAGTRATFNENSAPMVYGIINDVRNPRKNKGY